jgi:hypothetical protein
MDEEESTKRRQAMQSLKERLEQPFFLTDPPATDESSLADYLLQTQDIEMPQAHRLIAFAEFMSDKLSWTQTCAVFEYMLKMDAPEERNGTYAVWISKAEDVLSKTTSDSRNGIVQDLISIYERALDDTPQQPGLALGLGTRFAKEAARSDGDEYNIAQAVSWLNRAIEWLGPEEKRDAFAEYMVANCNLRLGQCFMLLRVYKLALEHFKAAQKADCLRNEELLELIEVIDKCTAETT